MGFIIRFSLLLTVFFSFQAWAQPAPSPLNYESAVGRRDLSNTPPTFKWNPFFDINEYSLGPGDVVSIHFWGAVELTAEVFVSHNNQLIIPGVETISVKGLKLKDLESRIKKGLKKKLQNTWISVALIRPREFIVRLKGAVNLNGEHTATLMTRLSDFIKSNGDLSSTASLIDIEIENNKTGHKKIINLQDYILLGDYENNPFLEEGDAVYVPFKKNQAILLGDLKRPGRFQFTEDAIPLRKVVENYLGGFINSKRVSGKISITRRTNEGTKTYEYSQTEFFNTKKAVNYETFMVRDGDHIYFPSEPVDNPTMDERVFITGQVKVPGAQKYKAGGTASSYISAAGGTTDRANFSKTVVYKPAGSVLLLSENPSIDPGDTIFVPEVTFKFWQDHLVILTTLLTVVTTTIAITR